jgi:hypothetical protein
VAIAGVHPETRASIRRLLVYRLQIKPVELQHMSTDSVDPSSGGIEQCVDEIDEFIGQLDRYALPVLAFALRTHLGELLRAMVDGHLCTREHVRQFVVELEQEALGVG